MTHGSDPRHAARVVLQVRRVAPPVLAGIGSIVFLAGAAAFDRESQTAAHVDLIISNAAVVTMNPSLDIVERGAIAITGSRIVAVGASDDVLRRYSAAEVYDASGRLIMPGLVNTHSHAPMTLYRGLGEDMGTKDKLEKVFGPLSLKAVDPQFAYWGALLACLDMIQTGTTTFADMYSHQDDIARAVKQAGMRAVLGESVRDGASPDSRNADEALSNARRFLTRWRGDPLVTPGVATHAPYSCSTATLLRAKRLAEEFDAPLLIHLAEAQFEMADIRERFKTTPVEYLNSIGFLSPRVIAAHGIHVSDNEIEILKARGVGVAHCPSSNMRSVNGVAPVTKYVKAGVSVGLGTDGASNNNDLNLFEEMDLAAKLQKITNRDATALRAAEAAAMATIEGARVVKMDKEIGSLEPGKKADLIVIEMETAHTVPLFNYYAQLVYSVKGADVQSSMVDGRWLMRERRMQTLNPSEILRKAREIQGKLRAIIDAEGPPAR